MKGFLTSCVVALAALAPSHAHAQASGAEPQDVQTSLLRIHGSNTIGEHLAPALIEAWTRSRGIALTGAADDAAGEREWQAGALRIRLQAHGSNVGMNDLLEGRADVAMSSRAATPAEIAAAAAAGLGRLDDPAQEFVVALDGLAIIVHPDNPLASLDRRTLQRIFAGELRQWGELGGHDGPVRLLARDDRSGTYDTFRSLVLGDTRLHPSARRFESTDELAAEVARNRHAIGFVGLAGIGRARALSIHEADTWPLPPDAETVAVEDYLLTRRLYVYLRADASPLARSFAAFAVGDAAQPVIERAGFVGQTIRTIARRPDAQAPAAYRDLVGDASRLSINFRFGTGAAVLDTRAVRDIERLAAFLRQPDHAEATVALLGFADASETLPYLAITLANDRVDYLAAQLAARGVPVAVARGIGGLMPVASNETDWGRRKNRRVEVWIRPSGR